MNIKQLLETYDFVGLAKAFAEADLDWHSMEWEKFTKAVREQERERIKDLIVKEINIARSENEKTSRLTSLYNKI